MEFHDDIHDLDTAADEYKPFSYSDVLKEVRKNLVEAGLIQERLAKAHPTAFERERYQAVKGLRACRSCWSVRSRAAFKGETCLWCLDEMDPDQERRLREEAEFAAWFERTYLQK